MCKENIIQEAGTIEEAIRDIVLCGKLHGTEYTVKTFTPILKQIIKKSVDEKCQKQSKNT